MKSPGVRLITAATFLFALGFASGGVSAATTSNMSGVCPQRPASTFPAGSIGAIVDSLAASEMISQGLPGMTVAIAKNGTILYAQGYGYTDLGTCLPATPGTVYQIDSVTKQFTAAAILQLQAAGSLDIDKPVITYLPGYAFDPRITVRMLLNQISGLQNYLAFPAAGSWYNGVSEPTVLSAIAQAPLLFTPGSAYAYSNSNFYVLGSIIEAVSSLPYADYMYTHIFQPVGLINTSYFQPQIFATPYYYSVPGDPSEGVVSTYSPNPSLGFSAGALWSNVLDLATWDAALFNDKVIPAQQFTEMVTPPSSVPLSNYGMGWWRTTEVGRPFIWHTGGGFGYAAYNGMFLDDGFSVSILTDVDPFTDILPFAESLIQAVAVQANPTGYWWNPAQPGSGFVIEIQGNVLFMAGFLYAADGEATWVASTGPLTSVTTYNGSLVTYAGGQTLTGPYVSPTQSAPLGTISIDFVGGTLTWPGGTIPIQRFDFGPGGYAAAQPATNPQAGWWWNPSEGGRGFAIEVQGGTMWLAGYMYDSAGNPTWYLATGAMTSPTLFQGDWTQYGNGQTLTGPFEASSVVNANVGAVTVQFASTTSATLTLPDGRQIPLARFEFGAPTSVASGTIVEFSTGISANSKPAEITLGPDGNFWFTEETGNRIARITAAGVVTEFSNGLTSTEPFGITTGPDGNLWFTERGGRIGRITTAGAITEFNGIPSGAAPIEITTGPDGNLWFTVQSPPQIGKITTAGAMTLFAGLSADAVPGGITVGPDGNLWFTENQGSRIGRITTSGAVTEFSAGITTGADPIRIVTGPDGNLWFTESNLGRIGRITPSGVVTEFSAGITAGGGPTGITLGPDGSLWFAETVASQIARITPSGDVTEFSSGITPGSQPYTMTTGPDGNLWFTEQVDRIGKITP